MKSNKVWIWIGVVVVVFIVVAAIFWKHSSAPSPVGVPQYAPQGQLVAGFPLALVLDTSAQVAGSYGINYSSSTNQYTAQWKSSKPLNDLYAAYKNYFQSNGWTISNEMTAYAGTKGLHAENATASVGLSINDNKTDRRIVVTYVTK